MMTQHIRHIPVKHTGFGPPGSGSDSQMYGFGIEFFYQAKIVKKTLTPTDRLLYDFLSLKNNVNVPSISTYRNKQKNLPRIVKTAAHH